MLRLHAGIFVLHSVMVATFVALPIALRDRAGVDVPDHWKVYVGVLLASVVFTVPLIVVADRANRSRTVMLLGIVLLGAALAGLAGAPAGGVALMACLVVYFTGFNTLEASLPAMVSRVAPMRARGAALGVYSTSQYLGAFAGGVLGGWFLGAGGERVVLAACAGLCVGWVLITLGLREPRRLSVERLPVGAVEGDSVDALTARLLAVPGVVEAGCGRRGADCLAAGGSPASGSKGAARVLIDDFLKRAVGEPGARETPRRLLRDARIRVRISRMNSRLRGNDGKKQLMSFPRRRESMGFRTNAPRKPVTEHGWGRAPTLRGTIADTGRGVCRCNLPGQFVKYLEGASSTQPDAESTGVRGRESVEVCALHSGRRSEADSTRVAFPAGGGQEQRD